VQFYEAAQGLWRKWLGRCNPPIKNGQRRHSKKTAKFDCRLTVAEKVKAPALIKGEKMGAGGENETGMSMDDVASGIKMHKYHVTVGRATPERSDDSIRDVLIDAVNRKGNVAVVNYDRSASG
jgi:hypothetical protein